MEAYSLLSGTAGQWRAPAGQLIAPPACDGYRNNWPFGCLAPHTPVRSPVCRRSTQWWLHVPARAWSRWGCGCIRSTSPGLQVGPSPCTCNRAYAKATRAPGRPSVRRTAASTSLSAGFAWLTPQSSKKYCCVVEEILQRTVAAASAWAGVITPRFTSISARQDLCSVISAAQLSVALCRETSAARGARVPQLERVYTFTSLDHSTWLGAMPLAHGGGGHPINRGL